MPDPHTKKTTATQLMDHLTGPGKGRRGQVNHTSIVRDLKRIRDEAVNLLRTITHAGGSVARDPAMNNEPYRAKTIAMANSLLRDGRALETSIKSYDQRIAQIETVQDIDVVFNDALQLTQDIAVTIEQYQGATVPMVEELFELQKTAHAASTETSNDAT